MTTRKEDNDNVFHERANILREQGYQGFTVSNKRNKWDGVQVTVENSDGRTVSAWGETQEEAYTNVIDNIDRLLDEPY